MRTFLAAALTFAIKALDWVIVVLAATALALLLVGCGGGDPEDQCEYPRCSEPVMAPPGSNT